MIGELLRCDECGSGDDVFKCRFCDAALCADCCTEIQSELECCAKHEARAVSALKMERDFWRYRASVGRSALERICALAIGADVTRQYAQAVGAMQGCAEFALERMK